MWHADVLLDREVDFIPYLPRRELSRRSGDRAGHPKGGEKNEKNGRHRRCHGGQLPPSELLPMP